MNDNYFHETSNHEWLLTNKTGGYALGTGNLINQRKYHGLLISSDSDLNRNHLLAGMEVVMEWRGETCFLDSTNYSSCIYPEGFLHIVKSWLRPYPILLYSTLHHNNDILIKKEIMMADYENTVLVKLTNLGLHRINFRIRPKLTMRNHHEVNHPGYWDEKDISLRLTDKEFSVKSNHLLLSCQIQKGKTEDEKIIYRDCYYPWEAIRGYYGVEDQLAPVKISFSLYPGESNYLIFSDTVMNLDDLSLSKKIEKIEKKYHTLPLPKDYPDSNSNERPLLSNLDYEDRIMFEYNEYMKILEFSLQDFLIGDDVIAGYPWFGCWGRDTFIYFEALIKTNVNHRLCWKIIKKYAAMIKEGLIPNMSDESGRGLNYHSIDATFWFVMSIYSYVNKVVSEELYGKKTIINDSIKYFKTIISGIISNTTHPFYIAENGLLYIKEEFASATWMDAKVNNNPVTPRSGAPVEINALFYNALSAFREIVEKHSQIKHQNNKLMDKVSFLIDKIKDSFSDFWIGDYLADRLENGRPIDEYRPNAVITCSLPFALLSPDKMKTLFQRASQDLATSYGLRTLSPYDYRFKKKYLGNHEERDSQYHQGTVWAWLLDPFVKTFFHAYKDSMNSAALIKEITEIIANLRYGYMKGHIASVAEVWDGKKPHFPKGCPAQAWSVAALFNIEQLINQLMLEKK